MFARSKAVETLHAALGVLARQWPALDDATRRDIEALIRRYGPAIINPATADELSPILSLLEGLRAIQVRLPLDAAASLDAAWNAPDQFMLRLTPEERQRLQDDMFALVDFRVYRDARGLAQRLSGLLGANLERLTPQEQSASHTLDYDFRQGGDPQNYLVGIERLLGWQIASIGALLDQGKALPRTWREALPEAAVLAPAASVQADGSPRVSRYANVFFPSALMVTQQRVPLIVYLARAARAALFPQSGPSEVQVAAGDVTIILTAEDFSLESSIGGYAIPGLDHGRVVHVTVERDSEPVIFFLTPRTAGAKQIVIDLYQNDRNIRSLSFPVNVVTDFSRLGDPRQAALEAIPVESAIRGAAAPPPDLELRVMLLSDGKTLSYTLHSPGGAAYNHQPAGQVQFAADPTAVLSPILNRLSSMARRQAEARTAEETARAMSELADIGNKLFDQLFSPELKEQYRRFRERYGGKSLLITTDEPWIPWEIVRPLATDDDGAILYDDPPLCEMFQVSRWIAGRGAPDFVAIRRGVWVAPADNLQAAQEESAYFKDLNRRRWSVKMQGPLETVADVEMRFADGHTELFHFACHGNFNADNPDESRLKLSGDFLSPNQIVGQRRAGLQRSRPIVFLNACHSGRVGAGLTGLGGWATQFIASGASAFIGSLWEVQRLPCGALQPRILRPVAGRGRPSGAAVGRGVSSGPHGHQAVGPCQPDLAGLCAVWRSLRGGRADRRPKKPTFSWRLPHDDPDAQPVSGAETTVPRCDPLLSARRLL